MNSGSGAVVTEHSSVPPARYWRFRQSGKLPFDDVVFDEEELEAQGLIDGTAQAGRGNTFFVNYHGRTLVLRHYRRGGLVQRISTRHYVYTGLEKTRAMREFDVLVQLQQLQLPAPEPFACEVIRRGLFYSASLVTYRLNGSTLAQYIAQGELSDATWQSIGCTIARFHRAGINHADLNAHNIMLEFPDQVALESSARTKSVRVALIDFDRARIVAQPLAKTDSGWCLENILRLKRSLKKLYSKSDADEVRIVNGFDLLHDAWRGALVTHELSNCK